MGTSLWAFRAGHGAQIFDSVHYQAVRGNGRSGETKLTDGWTEAELNRTRKDAPVEYRKVRLENAEEQVKHLAKKRKEIDALFIGAIRELSKRRTDYESM